MGDNNWEDVSTVRRLSNKKTFSANKRLSPKNFDLPVLSIFEDYEDKPSVYFLNLLEQLVMIDRGFIPVAFVLVRSNGRIEPISKVEFIKEAQKQYRHYIKKAENWRELKSRHPQLQNMYPLASREYYERRAHNRRRAAVMARSTRKKSPEKRAKAGTKRRANNISKNH